MGGVYADMDMEPLQPLDDLIEIAGQPACMLGLEPKEHAVMLYNKYHMVGNAFMASKANHPLWSWIIPQTIRRHYADRSEEQEGCHAHHRARRHRQRRPEEPQRHQGL